MGHGFNNMGRNTTFATRKEKAWHGLGRVVDSMTSEEAMIAGGLDFEVGLAPMYARIKEFSETPSGLYIAKNDLNFVSSNFATYRTDTEEVLGVVGSRYEPVQNTEAFKFFDEIIGEGHAEYETVGALGNGEVVFLTAKIPGDMVVAKENIDKYLLLTMSHDGTSSIQAMFTPIRVVCNNTLSIALKGTNKVSIRHTKNAKRRLDEAASLLGIVKRQSENLTEYFQYLNTKKVNDEDADLIFRKAFNIRPQEDGRLSTRSANKLNLIMNAYQYGIGQENIVGTAWGVYNGVTCYLQNHANYKTNEDMFKNSFMGKDELIRMNTVRELNLI